MVASLIAAAALLVSAGARAAQRSAPGAGQPPLPRIVSLAPSVTETLFALGAGPEVVGVSTYCDYPPEAKKLPKVGSFLTANVEAIVALRPTLVIGLNLSSDQRELQALRSIGISVLMVSEETLADIRSAIGTIGEGIGRHAQAETLLARLDSHIAETRRRLANAPSVRVLMLVGHQPLVAVGRGTFLDELLTMAHADNIADRSRQPWPRLSMEYIIAMAPQVIIDGQMGTEAARPGGFWNNYPTIPAVQYGRVYGYAQDPMLRPGPRAWQSFDLLAAMIHPSTMARDQGGAGAAGAAAPRPDRRDDSPAPPGAS